MKKLTPKAKEYIELNAQQTDRQLKDNIREKFDIMVSHVAIGNYKRKMRSEDYLPLKVQRILDKIPHKEGETEVLKSLTKLITIRQKALPDDLLPAEKRKIMNGFRVEVRTKQQEMAEYIITEKHPTYLNGLNEWVENVFKCAEDETRYKIEHATVLQEKFDEAMIDLSEYLTETKESDSFPLKFDFSKSTLKDDAQNLIDRCKKELISLSYKPEIKELNKQEKVIATKIKQLSNTRIKLEELIGEYDHRLRMLEFGRRELIGRRLKKNQ